MAWSGLATQFSLELAFGVLFALAFVPRAPVGRLFYRIMGTCALLPILAAALLPVWIGDRPASAPATLAALAAAAAWPLYASTARGARWGIGLAIGLLGCATALVLTLAESESLEQPAHLAIASLSALATGAVAGSVGLAMVLGHWYLTVPNLKVSHLRRLNRVTIGSMIASLAVLAASCAVFSARLADGDPSLFGPTGLFYFGTRVAVGLLLPLLFAWMTSGSLAFENTRSATGILYASTILVLIGTAVSVSLQDSFGVPL